MLPNNDGLSNNGDLSEDYDNLSAKSKAEGNGTQKLQTTSAPRTSLPSLEIQSEHLTLALDKLVNSGALTPAKASINGDVALNVVPYLQQDRSVCNAWMSTRLPAGFLASSEEETAVKSNDEPATSSKPPKKTQ